MNQQPQLDICTQTDITLIPDEDKIKVKFSQHIADQFNDLYARFRKVREARNDLVRRLSFYKDKDVLLNCLTRLRDEVDEISCKEYGSVRDMREALDDAIVKFEASLPSFEDKE